MTSSEPNEGTKTLFLRVKYRTPSLNVTKRSHWAKQQKEKHAAWDALKEGFHSAMYSDESTRSTATTRQLLQKILQTDYADFVSCLTTTRGSYPSPSSRKKSPTTKKKKH